MSLIPYHADPNEENGSLVLQTTSHRELVVVNPTNGSLKLYSQIYPNPGSLVSKNNNTSYNHGNPNASPSLNNNHSHDNGNFRRNSLGGESMNYICPTCGSEIHRKESIIDSSPISGNSNNLTTKLNLQNFPNANYFKLLESSHKRSEENTSSNINNHIRSSIVELQDLSSNINSVVNSLTNSDTEYNDIRNTSSSSNQSMPNIPQDLFTQGYFKKFFKIDSLLGRGARGVVYKVIHRLGDFQLGKFALKKIAIGNNLPWLENCLKEVRALTLINHTTGNLITYNHVWLEMDSTDALKLNENTPSIVACIFILQQYCDGGNLQDLIWSNIFKRIKVNYQLKKEKNCLRKKKFEKSNMLQFKKSSLIGLNTKQILLIIRDIASGLEELHSIGLIHRDLKPSNCLLLTKFDPMDIEQVDNIEDEEVFENLNSTFPKIVISDLGESQLKGEKRSATGATGTLEFTAPELIIENDIYTNLKVRENNDENLENSKINQFSFASDMYSFGMIIYFIVFGELPYDPELDVANLKSEIQKFHYNKEQAITKHKLIKNIKQIDPVIFEIMDQLLVKDVELRPNATEILEYATNVLNSSTYNNHYHTQNNSASIPNINFTSNNKKNNISLNKDLFQQQSLDSDPIMTFNLKTDERDEYEDDDIIQDREEDDIYTEDNKFTRYRNRSVSSFKIDPLQLQLTRTNDSLHSLIPYQSKPIDINIKPPKTLKHLIISYLKEQRYLVNYIPMGFIIFFIIYLFHLLSIKKDFDNKDFSQNTMSSLSFSINGHLELAIIFFLFGISVNASFISQAWISLLLLLIIFLNWVSDSSIFLPKFNA
ncbi:hypothetical protein TBLA_0D05210 [Henningerozyma blattae CBS 6284]|uniref:Protein kinase domain-containing protein n=1 Tax=Henningerozyma blattae (strain ATCC 34711 / CBS 6284 / DSM 70876 / NBRC 10599 / NRRL Y-10934 / UCD 77-7) TaxID=1071380 RepID=I2H3R2_HENB6|nr:hypothetical protein TBLA_0D05210 [Tetrapisispora blattae CBS 6284]CCH61014.1 hypothetical protein TBLA_0D05210 [Tetrapisispora blattae CBS 6284]